MNQAARTQEAEIISELKRLLAENPAVNSKLRNYLNLLQEKAADRYDSADNWAESCRIQGERRLLKQINRVVHCTT